MRSLPLLLGSFLTLSAVEPLRADDAFAPSKQAPAWAASAVWYQIFPDRFRNGDLKNEPVRASLETPIMAGKGWRVSPWTADWYARDEWEEALGQDFYKQGVFDRRYGGDLQGVLDKLPYLATLGVNALYFCPLFYARSLHKYDGNSYHHIDPYFGPDPVGDFALMDQETSNPTTWHWTAADKLFLRVVKEAHARGMKVIIDGVFNHTGRDFFAFKNIREKQEKSQYKDWYVVRGFDDPDTLRSEFEYDGWWGHKTLPVFASAKGGKDMAPGPKEYIFNSTRRWMDPDGNGNPANGIDGWRLDVADERPTEFWAEWNALVRQLNPQAYTTAETWKDPKPMILEGGFSATMNYFGFAIPVKGWLVDNHIKPSRFAKLMDERRNALPKADAYVMQNLMDSHDTDRLASMIVNGESTKYNDAEQIDYNTNNDVRDSPNYSIRKPTDRDRAIQRLVSLMQMTYVGAPMIYYGTEAGMWGAHDPDNRQAMVWADLKYDPQTHDPRKQGTVPSQRVAFDGEVFDDYKQAIALRKTHPVLNTGEFALLAADDMSNTLTFQRGSGTDALVVVINRSDTARMVSVKAPAGLDKPTLVFASSPSSGVDVKAEGGNVRISLPALTGAVVGKTAP